MYLSSSSFKEGQTIPRKHTCDGIDISPRLNWGNVPENCKSLALICEDPDAPAGTWTHWIIFNISPNNNGLPEAVPKTRVVLGGAKQGINDFGDLGYGGPCPPGKTPHHYIFKLYALNSVLRLDSGIDRLLFLAAINNRILSKARLTGKYGR